jgi:pyruvate dehydrogenase E2 component (dihydrolipoamide acetyltransferase)
VSGSGPRGAVVKRDVEAFKRSSGSGTLVNFGGAASTASSGRSVLKTLQAGVGDPVLFVHGFGAELSAWRSFIGHISVANPILAIDLPGHGGAANASADSFDDVVAVVRATLAAEKIERLHLVGHSLGAAVATTIAGGGDFDVRSLTLIAPAGLGPKINGDYVSGFLSADSEAALQAWLGLLVHEPASLPGVLVRATLSGREGTGMVANQTRLAAGVFAGSTQLFSVRDALNRFGGPARVIVGEQDRIIPAEHSNALPAHVGLHRLPQVGHLPQLEAAPLVGRLVSQTIRSAS